MSLNTKGRSDSRIENWRDVRTIQRYRVSRDLYLNSFSSTSSRNCFAAAAVCKFAKFNPSSRSNAFHFLHGRTGGGRNAVHQQIQINGLITAAGKNDVCPSRNGYPPSLQCSTKRQSPGLVNFITALSYHFCLALPSAFTQPGAHLIEEPCMADIVV